MSLYDFSATLNNGTDTKLSAYRGKVLLIVNTASQCGNTPQYAGLQELYAKYRDRGFEVLAFPCNQFGHQEPGSNEEIKEFCEMNYGVEFPLFSKIEVNGEAAHPLYKFLKSKKGGLLGESIKWNFTKFLVDWQGNVIKRYAPMTPPQRIASNIERLVRKQAPSNLVTKQALFNEENSFVFGDAKASGFGDLQLPDRFRWMQRRARCHCQLPDQLPAEPALLLRALPGSGPGIPYLSVVAESEDLGGRPIPKYGTYYFHLPLSVLKKASGGLMQLELHTGLEAEGLWTGERPQVGLYEIRVIDLQKDSFPDREEFLQQVKLFQADGGQFYQFVREYPFNPSQQLLEIGSGIGVLSCLMAAFTKAKVWGIDVRDYGDPKDRGFAQELLDRLRIHGMILERTSGLESAADPNGLRDAIRRTTLVTMSAEEMLFADNTFHFVFSLNVMEHIPHPDRALREICRVLKPGGRALLQFSPLYYSETGSHLFCVGYNRPWAHLLMTRDEIKEACRREGANVNEIDSILDSLNGWRPQQYVDAVENSGLRVLYRRIDIGFATPGAAESEEFKQVKKIYPEQDLTTTLMLWLLEKPAAS